jgi:hypothetical protein
MLPFLREHLLSLTTSVLPEGVSSEELGKELDAGIAESNMQAKMEQYSTIVIDLDTGWTMEWWNKRRLSITTDEGETQTIVEKEVVISDE